MQPVVIENPRNRRLLLIFFVFLLLAFLLFAPVIYKGFVSDDFSILHRIIRDRHFFSGSLFRPLSDLSLYFSWVTGGFNPVVFNCTNIAIHAANAFLLYLICGKIQCRGGAGSTFMAWAASLLFLVYPFHNEAIVWAIARGIVLSGFFGMLSILMVFTQLSKKLKYGLSGLFYFAGLCGYETILLLPLIVFVLKYRRGQSLRACSPGLWSYGAALGLNFFLRKLFAGSLSDNYGNRLTSFLGKNGWQDLFKVAGRLFVPPSRFSGQLIVFSALIFAGLLIITIHIFRSGIIQRSNYARLSLCLLLSLAIPALFGVSTRTFEGDRVLYFTSFFLCLWVAFLLSLAKTMWMRWAFTMLTGIYFIYFFEQSLMVWKRSAAIADHIIAFANANAGPGRTIYMVNMPEEIGGGQVFRNGFAEALVFHGIDTAEFKVVSYINTASAEKTIDRIQPEYRDSLLFIYPSALVGKSQISARTRMNPGAEDSCHYFYTVKDRIAYWDKESMQFLH